MWESVSIVPLFFASTLHAFEKLHDTGHFDSGEVVLITTGYEAQWAEGRSCPSMKVKRVDTVWKLAPTLQHSITALYQLTYLDPIFLSESKKLYNYVKNSVARFRDRTIPTERSPLVG
jgi:hypothetical protein